MTKKKDKNEKLEQLEQFREIGVANAEFSAMKKALLAEGAVVNVIAPRGGTLKGDDGESIKIDHSLLTTSSVLFDAVYVPGGNDSVATLINEAMALHFINEAYMHCKTISATGDGAKLLSASYLGAAGIGLVKGDEKDGGDPGVILGSAKDVAKKFIEAVAKHRHWTRNQKDLIPA